jgi:hypothetical protein
MAETDDMISFLACETATTQSGGVSAVGCVAYDATCRVSTALPRPAGAPAETLPDLTTEEPVRYDRHLLLQMDVEKY